MTSPACAFVNLRIPCGDCNRYFRGRTCFDNHKKQQLGADRRGRIYVNRKDVVIGAVPLSRRRDMNVTSAT